MRFLGSKAGCWCLPIDEPSLLGQEMRASYDHHITVCCVRTGNEGFVWSPYPFCCYVVAGDKKGEKITLARDLDPPPNWYHTINTKINICGEQEKTSFENKCCGTGPFSISKYSPWTPSFWHWLAKRSKENRKVLSMLLTRYHKKFCNYLQNLQEGRVRNRPLEGLGGAAAGRLTS